MLVRKHTSQKLGSPDSLAAYQLITLTHYSAAMIVSTQWIKHGVDVEIFACHLQIFSISGIFTSAIFFSINLSLVIVFKVLLLKNYICTYYESEGCQ